MLFFRKLLFILPAGFGFFLSFSRALAMEYYYASHQPQIALLYGTGSTDKIQDILKQKKLIPSVSYFIGGSYRSSFLKETPIKLEMQVLKHFGKQSALEWVVCPVLETPRMLMGNLGFTWAVGNGVSSLTGKGVAFEAYKGVKTKRVLNYLFIEQNMFLKEDPRYLITIRWHHRCHFFGRVAPKRTGSNFFVIGIKLAI